MLDLSKISHSFAHKLFEDISFSIQENQRIAIVGESGCGKSTLLHIMSTFLNPQSGHVSLFGKDIYSLSQEEIIYNRRHNLSIIFQQHYLFKGFLLHENLKVASLICNEEVDEDLLFRFGLSTKKNLHISSLSGGEQQRVSIVRSLMKKPRLIFADEPTGNLDYKNSCLVVDSLFDYTRDTNSSIVLITHDRSIASKCDRVYEIDNQRLNLIS